MNVIVALGNPGKEYEKTRHNAGRLVMKAVLEKWQLPEVRPSAKFGGQTSEGDETRVVFPDTYMNHSGSGAFKALAGEKPEHLIVIYDDIDLPIGEFKLSYGRGSGGHNGLQSVIDRVGTTDFVRVRIGIAHKTIFGRVVRPTGDRLANYVLGELTTKEEKKILAIAHDVAEALSLLMKEGKEKAMNKFN